MPAKLLLIDAHALIHRSYHAIERELTSPTGEPTKAVYGFASTLLKVIKDQQPDYVVATFDMGKSFRSAQYPEYKANRPPTPDDLRPQFARSREFCAVLGIPVFAREGFEADDLIGTLSLQARGEDLYTVILTGDRDTLQLVDDQTNVLMFIGYTGEIKLYDANAVRERFGFGPTRLIDFKALRGDTSDNIPGIAGVGDKTATKLLQDYETIEGIYQHLDEIKGSVGEKLAAAHEQVIRNKELVTIDRHVPIALDLQSAKFGAYDRERLIQLMRELGFQSLLARIPGSTGEVQAEPTAEPATPQIETKYQAVTSKAELDALVKRIKKTKRFVVDVETTSLEPLHANIVGIAIGVGDGEAYYIPVSQDTPKLPPAPKKSRTAKEQKQPALFESGGSAPTIAISTANADPLNTLPLGVVRDKLNLVLSDAKIEKIAHNAGYDWGVLRNSGFEVSGFSFDTMIAAHLVEQNSQAVGLKNLAFQYFGAQMTEIEKLIGKGKNQLTMDQVSIDELTDYASADADYTFRLYEVYKPLLAERGVAKLFYEIEMPLVGVVIDLERAGVLLDLDVLGELAQEINARLTAIETQVYAMVGAPFNLNSPVQLSDALFEKLGLSSQGMERTSTGKISTAAGALENLRGQHPVIPLILEHRELSKLKGTYVDALPELIHPEDGRVHTSFNQAGTVTGRLSSSNPNLQNIPVRTELGRRVRGAFIAPKGTVLLSADYSQVELRILAHASQDPNMLKAFADGEDIHAATAALLFNVPIDQVTKEMRRLGKTINFGVVYGISEYGVAGRTELSFEESRRLIQSYNEKYPGVKAYMDRTKAMARDKGYVESFMGRRRYFPDLGSGRRLPPAQKNQAEREAINMPIQASAADIIKIAMIRLHRTLRDEGLKTRMILQVHDELVFECPKDETARVVPLIREIMCDAYKLDAPLDVEIKSGANWQTMQVIPV